MTIGPLHYTWRNALRGILIYSIGDSIAALILGEFSLTRMFMMMLVGGTFYTIEIPNYFRWIDHVLPDLHTTTNALKRATLATIYFNPLWIARHFLFIEIGMGRWERINWDLLMVALWSFLVSVPVAFTANYIIQNKLSYHRRFIFSAVFSGLMAIFFALSLVFL